MEMYARTAYETTLLLENTQLSGEMYAPALSRLSCLQEGVAHVDQLLTAERRDAKARPTLGVYMFLQSLIVHNVSVRMHTARA